MKSNRSKCWLFSALACAVYSIPLVVLAIVKRDLFLKTPRTTISFFGVLILLFIGIHFRKYIKSVCKLTTYGVFGSAIALFLSYSLMQFTQLLVLICFCSLVGALGAWYFARIASEYYKGAYDENGEKLKNEDGTLKNDLTFKDVNKNLL